MFLVLNEHGNNTIKTNLHFFVFVRFCGAKASVRYKFSFLCNDAVFFFPTLHDLLLYCSFFVHCMIYCFTAVFPTLHDLLLYCNCIPIFVTTFRFCSVLQNCYSFSFLQLFFSVSFEFSSVRFWSLQFFFFLFCSFLQYKYCNTEMRKNWNNFCLYCSKSNFFLPKFDSNNFFFVMQ